MRGNLKVPEGGFLGRLLALDLCFPLIELIEVARACRPDMPPGSLKGVPPDNGALVTPLGVTPEALPNRLPGFEAINQTSEISESILRPRSTH